MKQTRAIPRRLVFALATMLSWAVAAPAFAAGETGYPAVNFTNSGDPGGELPVTGIDVELALIAGLCMIAVGITLAAIARSREHADG